MWLRKFIPCQSQCNKVGGTLSEFVDFLSGAIQGSALGPLVFITFINELAEILEKFGIAVKLFADDIKPYVKITNDVDLSVLQAAINALCQWADT